MFQADEELIEACRNGKETAWEDIVLKYQKLLFSIPRRAGLNQDFAADVLQEVFTALFQQLDKLEKPEYLRAWLITTTRHKTINLIQKERRGKLLSIQDIESEGFFEIPDEGLLPDEILIRFEQEARIENAVKLIDERCRKLLIMLYLEKEQIPYSEISRILNIPLGSIGPTRSRCLQKLLKFIPE